MESDFTIWNMCNADSDRLQRSDKGITEVEKIEKPLDTDKTDKHALTDRQTDRQTDRDRCGRSDRQQCKTEQRQHEGAFKERFNVCSESTYTTGTAVCHKEVQLIGGIGNIWGSQYRQQNRVYDRKFTSPSMNVSGYNGLIIRKWKRS